MIPGFVLPLKSAKYIKLIIGTQGYEKYIISEGILSVQHPSQVMFTHYAQDGLLNHIHRRRMNEEILVRTSRGMADYTFRKIPTQGMLSDANLKMWNFPQFNRQKKK